MRRSDTSGFTYIELLTAMALLAVLVAIAWGRFGDTADRAVRATIQSDLRNLATAQELYWREFQVYTTNSDLLQMSPSPKSDITLTTADAKGWSAWATHSRTPDLRCEIYVGEGHSAPLGIATTSEKIACEES